MEAFLKKWTKKPFVGSTGTVLIFHSVFSDGINFMFPCLGFITSIVLNHKNIDVLCNDFRTHQRL